METLPHDDNDRLCDIFFPGKQARQFYRGLVGLRAGVGEKGPLHGGKPDEPLRELRLQRNAIEVRGMDQALGLIGNGGQHGGMGMAQAANRDPAQRIQITLALAVRQPGALPPHKLDRQRRII